ncbi:MAG: Hpt domain-containing protein [Planctomycetes bacterium]|nr:Hpt domain-containing protein [Planctomycetota bacterium]
MASINPRVIADLRSLQSGGSPGFLAELIDLFLKEAEAHVTKLRESLAARDAKVFERSAHTLKGSCGNLGAQAMSRICADLQNVGHDADWTRAAELLPGLEAEFRTVTAELRVERERP